MIVIIKDLSKAILEQLKKRGYKQNGGYAIRGNPRVLTNGMSAVAVVLPIMVDPTKSIPNQVDKFFKTLMDIIAKNRIQHVVLPGGGDIPIPPDFDVFCKKNGIKVYVISENNLGDMDQMNL